ncbi:multiple epidermal growth factor-like domains protein 11, partial [Biomphalaria glabrata]
CDIGWFGDKCQYQCHCNTICKTSGDCTENKCSPGWFGYKCQYRDLMYLAKLDINRVITDKEDSTCITRNLDNITISWNEANVFTWLRIVVNNETFLTDLQIQFQKDEKSNAQILPCQNQRYYLVDSRTIDVWCDLEETFQVLRLTGKVILSLCTLNINGGRNFALKQKTNLSSTYSSTKYNYTQNDTNSSNAVDGKSSEIYLKFDQKSCAHTADGDKNPTWSVEFPPRMVTGYVLYDRTDADNLFGFKVTSSLEQQALFLFNDTGAKKLFPKIYRIADSKKNFVSRVTLTRQNILNVCEVEVYGECPTGTWGLACTNCSQDCPNECHVEDGRCVNLCLGFINPPSCDLPCNKSHYGINCTKQCSNNCKNSECDPKTGECLQCKRNGTYSGYCAKTCKEKKWGWNCSENCSTNCVNQSCDKGHGRCLNGCIKNQTWGDRCDQRCPKNCFQATCNQTTGACTNGCSPGFQSPNCAKECGERKWGKECSKDCSTTCISFNCNKTSGECIS